MTNKERLLSLLGFEPADKNALDGALLDLGIDGAGVYDGSNQVLLKTAAIQIMELLLTTADTQNENSYQITYDRDAVLARINLLKGEIGLIDDTKPYITHRNVW